jgi:hypothetical protein
VGALSGVLLPYLAIAPILGIHTTDVRAYDTYSSTVVGAVVGSAIGTLFATRSAFRIEIRPVLPLAVGLVVLAFWLTFWVLWELRDGRRRAEREPRAHATGGRSPGAYLPLLHSNHDPRSTWRFPGRLLDAVEKVVTSGTVVGASLSNTANRGSVRNDDRPDRDRSGPGPRAAEAAA